MSDETGHAADTDEVLIEALGRGATQAEASKLAGCAVRTVARRLDDPQFVRRVDVFRDALVEWLTEDASLVVSNPAAA